MDRCSRCCSLSFSSSVICSFSFSCSLSLLMFPYLFLFAILIWHSYITFPRILHLHHFPTSSYLTSIIIVIPLHFHFPSSPSYHYLFTTVSTLTEGSPSRSGDVVWTSALGVLTSAITTGVYNSICDYRYGESDGCNCKMLWRSAHLPFFLTIITTFPSSIYSTSSLPSSDSLNPSSDSSSSSLPTSPRHTSSHLHIAIPHHFHSPYSLPYLLTFLCPSQEHQDLCLQQPPYTEGFPSLSSGDVPSTLALEVLTPALATGVGVV